MSGKNGVQPARRYSQHGGGLCILILDLSFDLFCEILNPIRWLEPVTVMRAAMDESGSLAPMVGWKDVLRAI